MKIAVAQPLVVPGNVAENFRRMQPLVREARERGAALILFSECGLTGYDFAGRGRRAALDLDELGNIAALARRRRIAIVTGLYERGPYNTAVAFLPDGRRIVQRKHKIAPREPGVLAAPRQRHVFDYRGHRFGILICADTGARGIFGDLEAQGCDVVLLMTAGLGDAAKGFHQHELQTRQSQYLKAARSVCFVEPLVKRALRHRYAIAACNQCGHQGAYFQPGHSAVITGAGEITALIPGRFVLEHLRPDLAVGSIG